MEYPVVINSDGRELYGILNILDESKGLILVCHGLGGTRVDVHRICVSLARELEKNGYSSLRIDFTGSGISQGTFLDFTFDRMHSDIRNILTWLLVEKEIKKVYLLGFSDGAFAAFNSGAHAANVEGLIFWSPNFILKDGKDSPGSLDLSRRLHRVREQMAWPVLGHWVYREYFSDRDQELKKIDFHSLQKKALIVYGEKDEEVKKGIIGIKHPLVRIVEIKGANHLYFSPLWTEQVVRSTIEWLNQNEGYTNN